MNGHAPYRLLATSVLVLSLIPFQQHFSEIIYCTFKICLVQFKMVLNPDTVHMAYLCPSMNSMVFLHYLEK